jgi:putative tricarboxylic transport membrane protein
MRLNDRLSGVLTLIFGALVAAYAQTFPPMPGQPVGPSLFPTVVGVGLIVLGAALTLGGARRTDGPWIAFDEWTGRPRMILNVTLVTGAVLFYAITVDWLGFLIAALLFLIALFLAFGVRRTHVVPLALAVTLFVHYGFYTLLRVPLPWGLLEGIAW